MFRVCVCVAAAGITWRKEWRVTYRNVEVDALPPWMGTRDCFGNTLLVTPDWADEQIPAWIRKKEQSSRLHGGSE